MNFESRGWDADIDGSNITEEQSLAVSQAKESVYYLQPYSLKLWSSHLDKIIFPRPY